MWLTKNVKRWKFIGRWLGLSETEISTIEKDYPQDSREQCYQMFMQWKSEYPHDYCYPVLGEALKKESQELFQGFVEEVDQVENDIKPTKNP